MVGDRITLKTTEGVILASGTVEDHQPHAHCETRFMLCSMKGWVGK